MLHLRRQIICPAPRYHDAWAAIALLERSFGFQRQQVHEVPHGTVAHRELRLGVAGVGLSSAEGRVQPDNPWTSVRSGVYVALPDAAAVEAHHARSRAAGAVTAMPLENTNYGSRQYLGLGSRAAPVVFRDVHPGARRGVAPVSHASICRPQAGCDWLQHAFGFERIGPEREPAAEHVELRLGEGRLWLNTETRDHAGWDDNWYATYVVLSDVGAHYERARRTGARIVSPPTNRKRFGHVCEARDTEDYPVGVWLRRARLARSCPAIVRTPWAR